MDDRRVLDIHITGYCNMNCEFCCGAPRNLEGPNLEDFKRIVDKIEYIYSKISGEKIG